MSHVIYLLRHGIAEDLAADGTDVGRQLTADGVRKTTEVARGMKALRIRPDAILSSPLRRAEQTARIVADVLGEETDVEIVTFLAPGHTSEDIVRGLRPRRSCRQLLLVGHQPDMGEMASYLLTGAPTLVTFPFRKAGLAAISMASLPPRASGSLEWFLTPGQLRAIGQRGR